MLFIEKEIARYYDNLFGIKHVSKKGDLMNTLSMSDRERCIKYWHEKQGLDKNKSEWYISQEEIKEWIDKFIEEEVEEEEQEEIWSIFENLSTTQRNQFIKYIDNQIEKGNLSTMEMVTRDMVTEWIKRYQSGRANKDLPQMKKWCWFI